MEAVLELNGAIFIVLDSTIFGHCIGDPRTEWIEITAPENQVFLDSINAYFGTYFKFDDFAGR